VIGWLALVLVLALLVVLADGARRSWVRQREAETEAAWREVAARIGHAYSTADVPHELDRLPLPLLARIDAGAVAPELTGPSEGGIQRLFIAPVDGRRATLGVADLARPVPACSLRPVGADGPTVGAGWEPQDPGLAHVSARFEVRGEDAEAIGAFLGGSLGGWLAGEGTEWSIELAGNHLLVVREEMPVERLDEVAAVLDALRARLPWATTPTEAAQREPDADAGSPSGTGKRRRRRRGRRRGGDRAAGGSGGGSGEPSTEG
jgi:hypothetical protein